MLSKIVLTRTRAKEGGNSREILSNDTVESISVHIAIRITTILLGDASPNKTIQAKVEIEKKICI
jgi:hypothetical protein